MIYTCTMNPAIDLFIMTNDLKKEAVNRTIEQQIIPNGKAVNVSFLLKMLGVESTALGFSAGFTGRFIEDELAKKNIKTDFIHIDGTTRINVFTWVCNENTEYKLVNPGPEPSSSDIIALLKKIETLNEDDILCVSGSNPKGVSDDIYIDMAKLSQKNRFRFVLDSSSPSVRGVMFSKPFLIKPTLEELAAWFGKNEITKDEGARLAMELVDSGAQHVLLSLGKDGAFYFDAQHRLQANAPSGKVVNTSCAGDTMVASFLCGLLTNKTMEETLQFSVAAASSTAFCPGLTDYHDVEHLMREVNVKPL
ncbi:tagatose-6-phosphate kinase [Spirochaetia bacterium]|nr:tagatose-6-phosphate kinase [Spirochaetia bacterium]